MRITCTDPRRRKCSTTTALVVILITAHGHLHTTTTTGRAWAEADGLFRGDARWLGGDAALSVPLSPGRTLWLFGDSFIAAADTAAEPSSAVPALRSRRGAALVRNSVAVQTGDDPRTASVSFYWGQHVSSSSAGATGECGTGGMGGSGGAVTPVAFFRPQEDSDRPTGGGCGCDAIGRGGGNRWFWPGHGIRLAEGPLVVFLLVLEAVCGGLGFKVQGFAVAVVDDPDAPPDAWRPRVVPGPPGPFRQPMDAIPASAVVRWGGGGACSGDWVVGLAVQHESGACHAGSLVRWPAASLAKGDLAAGCEWWAGRLRGWVAAAVLQREVDEDEGAGAGAGEAGAGAHTHCPAFVMGDAGAECSLHWEPGGCGAPGSGPGSDPCRDAGGGPSGLTGRWVHVASYGFGRTVVGLRVARELEGPWTDPPLTVFTPPECVEEEDEEDCDAQRGSEGCSGGEGAARRGPTKAAGRVPPRHPFVYAAKAHPWAATADVVATGAAAGERPPVLTDNVAVGDGVRDLPPPSDPPGGAPGQRLLLVTYATNSFDFGDLFTAEGQRSLYWPRLALVRAPEAGSQCDRLTALGLEGLK